MTMKAPGLFILCVALPASLRSLPLPINVNDRVIARWTNNVYYRGKVSARANEQIHILFDDGDRIAHSIRDVSAVIPDQQPQYAQIGQRVMATWKEGLKYYMGYVTDNDSVSCFKVTFDDNDEDFYDVGQLRMFPDLHSTHQVGARVFARWTDGRYYRGFVTNATSTTVVIRYDDGDTIRLHNIDGTAVILDNHLPCYTDVYPGQRIIGYWPNRERYYAGVVTRKMDTLSVACYQKAVYHVAFDDGDKRIQDFHQIRVIP